MINILTRMRTMFAPHGWTFLWITFGVSLLLLVFLFNNYTPLEIGPNGILLFFLVLYVVVLTTAMILVRALRYFFHRSFSMVKALNLASVVAFAPVMLLALNTINQLQFLDIILVLIFELLAIFYISRRGK